jgi:hypothetical protein
MTLKSVKVAQAAHVARATLPVSIIIVAASKKRV